MNKLRWLMCGWLMGLLLCVSCGDDSTGAPLGPDAGGQLDSASVQADGSTPKSCAYSKVFACWACAGGTPGQDYSVGCRAQDVCAQFCGPRPSSWQACAYTGEGYSPPFCNSWPYPERGTLAGCSATPNTDVPGGTAYQCPFCPGGGQHAVTFAGQPDGPCLAFIDTCIPEGFQSCSPP